MVCVYITLYTTDLVINPSIHICGHQQVPDTMLNELSGGKQHDLGLTSLCILIQQLKQLSMGLNTVVQILKKNNYKGDFRADPNEC